MAVDTELTCSNPSHTEVLEFFGKEVILVENLYGLWRALNTSHSADAELAYEMTPEFAEHARFLAAEQLIVVVARLIEKRIRNDSVTLDFVLETCKCKSDEIQDKVDEAAKRFRESTKNVMAHRNNRIAHTDRKLAFGKGGWSKLPTGTSDDIDNAVRALIDIHIQLDGDHSGVFGYGWRSEDSEGKTTSSLDGGAYVYKQLLKRFSKYWELTTHEHKLSDEQIVRAIRTGNIQQVLDSIDTDQDQVDL
jgi:AbiU2